MLKFLYNKTNHMRFQYAKGYSDYYPEKPGGFAQGRSIEPLLFDLKKMGALVNTMRRTTMPTKGFTMNSYEFHKVNMIKRTTIGKMTALKLGLRLVKSKVTGSQPVALGASLVRACECHLQKQTASYGFRQLLKILSLRTTELLVYL